MAVEEQIIEQLWELADGQCSPEQASSLQSLIAKDEAIASTWREIEQVQLSLNSIDVAQPSMRFQQNILDKLPARPLVNELVPSWVRWLVISGFILAFLPILLCIRYTESSPNERLLVIDWELLHNATANWLPNLQWPTLAWTSSPQILLYFALLGVGLSLLLMIDRIIQKQGLR